MPVDIFLNFRDSQDRILVPARKEVRIFFKKNNLQTMNKVIFLKILVSSFECSTFFLG